jgi:hypothetical protein
MDRPADNKLGQVQGIIINNLSDFCAYHNPAK